MQRPRLSLAMRDNWRHLQRLYGLDLDCDDYSPPRRAPSLDSLINSSEGAVSSADASAPEDSDSGADTRADPEPPRRKAHSNPDRIKKCPQSFSSSSSGHMETIHEETTEPKVSVKEILARFENLTENTQVMTVFVCSVPDGNEVNRFESNLLLSYVLQLDVSANCKSTFSIDFLNQLFENKCVAT